MGLEEGRGGAVGFFSYIPMYRIIIKDVYSFGNFSRQVFMLRSICGILVDSHFIHSFSMPEPCF